MTFLLIAAMIAAMILLYATDRVLKARVRARRYRAMSERLDAAAARTDKQQEQRKTAATASAALTSVMPAINRPPLTLPGVTRQQQHATPDCEAKPGREATGPRDHRPARPGDKQAHAGDGTAYPRPLPAERSGRPGHSTGPRQPNHR